MRTRVIILRMLASLLVTLTAVNVSAQDSYRQAVIAYDKVNGSFDKMSTSFKGLGQAFFKDADGVDVNQLTERYFTEVAYEQYIDFMESMMKQHNISEGELTDVTQRYSSPQGKTFLAHQQEWVAEMMSTFLVSFFENSSSLRESNTAPDVSANPDIDPEFAAQFKRMYGMGTSQEILESMMGRMSQADSSQTMSASVMQWMAKNFYTIALNSASGILTLDDIEFGMSLFSTSGYAKLANPAFMNFDDLRKSMTWAGGYIEWMKAQGAPLRDNEPGMALKLIESIYGPKAVEKLKGLFGPKHDEGNGKD